MAQPPSSMEDTPASAATVYTLGDALARPRASCVAGRTSGAGDCRTAGCSPGAKHETAARGRSRRPADGATRAGRMGAAGWSAAAAVWAMLHTRARGADCLPSSSIRGRRLRRRGRLGARSPVASWLRRTCAAVRRVTTVAVVVFFFLLLPPSLPMVGYMYLALSRVQRPRTNTHEILFNPLPSPPQSLAWRPSIFPQGCHHQSASIQHFFMACSVNAPCTPLRLTGNGIGFSSFLPGEKIGHMCLGGGRRGPRRGWHARHSAGGRAVDGHAGGRRPSPPQSCARAVLGRGRRERDRHTLPFCR